MMHRTPHEPALTDVARDEGATEGEDAAASTLLTAVQLSERWQVPVRTIYAWAKRNEIPHYRVGRLLRFDFAEVQSHCRRAGFAEKIVPVDEHPGESAFTLLTA